MAWSKLAVLAFPDGSLKYCEYLDFTGSICCDRLYSRPMEGTKIPPDGACLFAHSVGDKVPADPTFPELPWSADDDLIQVSVTVGSESSTWSALYCPRRRMLRGPDTPLGYHLKTEFVRMADAAGTIHMARFDDYAGTHPDWIRANPIKGACGKVVEGEATYLDTSSDVIADWHNPAACRACLLQTIDRFTLPGSFHTQDKYILAQGMDR